MKNEEVVQLHLDDIIPNRFQPREYFEEQGLKELAVSIKEHGVIQPIIVRQIGDKYEIIAGERRYKASSMIGNTNIPAIIKNLNDKDAAKVALIENVQRRDLTPIEEAKTYQKILNLDEDMTQEELAQTMGKSQSAVANKLRLLNLSDEVQQALLTKKISERHARSLLKVENQSQQQNLLKEIIEERLPVREVEKRIKETNQEVVKGESNMEDLNSLKNDQEIIKINENEALNQNRGMMTEEASPLNNIENEQATNVIGTEVSFANTEMNQSSNVVGTPVSEAEVTPVTPMTGMNFENINQENNETTNVFSEPNPQGHVEPLENENLGINPMIDQTVVDINKIKEESADINPSLEKTGINFEELLKGEGTVQKEETVGPKKFIPDLISEEELSGPSPLLENFNEQGSPISQTDPAQSLSGILEQEKSVSPLTTMQEPLNQAGNDFIDNAPLGIENNTINIAAPDNINNLNPVPNSNPQAGEDFRAKEEIRFANVAINNVANDLKVKGFNASVVESEENGVLKIILEIQK